MKPADLLADLPARSLDQLLNALASRSMVPAAGTAVGVVLALAAACAQKAVAVTLRRDPTRDEMAAVDVVLANLRQRALLAAADDGLCYLSFAQEREPEIAEALLDAGERFLACAEELGQLIDRLQDRIDPVVAGDLATAVTLQRAVVDAVREILRDNRRATADLLAGPQARLF